MERVDQLRNHRLTICLTYVSYIVYHMVKYDQLCLEHANINMCNIN